MSRVVYLGLGANLGRRALTMDLALWQLRCATLRIQRVSLLYESAPQGPILHQPPFYNAVAELSFSGDLSWLLSRCQKIEQQLGRRRDVAQGPRTIDLDLLLAEDACITDRTLTIPHPEICRRAFVLRPLLELAPYIREPGTQRPLSSYLAAVQDQQVTQLGRLERYAAIERFECASHAA